MIRRIIACLALLLILVPSVTHALTQDALDSVLSGTEFYDPNATSESCSSSANLVGSENAEKIYHFFISQGMQPYQAAGIMGNMQAESHFETRLVEYGYKNSRGEVSR